MLARRSRAANATSSRQSGSRGDPHRRHSGSRQRAAGPHRELKGDGGWSGVTETFEPGARTAWHTHRRGQTLVMPSRLRPRAARRRADRGDQARRYRFLRDGREALAWRLACHGRGASPSRRPRVAAWSTGLRRSAAPITPDDLSLPAVDFGDIAAWEGDDCGLACANLMRRYQDRGPGRAGTGERLG